MRYLAKRPLLLMGHTDVVNVDPKKRTFPPFSATRDGGYIYGRGTVDDKDNLVGSLMVAFGQGAALATTKIFAAFLGIVLHLRQVHGAVAILTGLYLMMAILPWTTLLFF